MANTTVARWADGSFAHCTNLGSYPIYHICDDGGTLCPDCANEHGHIGKPDDGWRIVASDVNWEDAELYCDHCGERLEPAYGEA